MGQYYRFINIDKKERCDRRQGLLKITEHSYLANEHCTDILTLMSDEWKGDRIIHVGDYASGNDNTTTSKLISQIEKENNLNRSVYDWGNTFKDVKPKRVNNKIRYVYNLDKKEYIDLIKQSIQWCCYDDNKIYFAKFNAFALLTGCGNEQGGGDYYSINKKRIGFWAGDRLVSSATLLKEYSNFNEQKYLFDEWLDLSRRIKNINEKSEREILNGEGIILKRYLKRIKEYHNIDVSKLEIANEHLTEKEFKHFNTILKKYKKRELLKEQNLSLQEEKDERNYLSEPHSNSEISAMDQLII